MIINNTSSNVETTGDIKEFRTSIDPKNIDFIVTLLSSNLYSNPEQSFIREIVSNAWDSHVEAGTTDIPVIIKFTDGGIIIRDYGTGLSPERFNEIYRNIGSSTKRDSNDYIGCFGIGHLSPFACSSSVYITSYYNGIAYYYVGTKVGNSITYHQLNKEVTTEKNGVEITVAKINYSKVVTGLNYLAFFPNIYVDGISNSYNDIKVKRYKYFAAASIDIEPKILLGNVLYDLNRSYVDRSLIDFINSIQDTGIVISFNIGELEITPNRESIIYTTETIKKINNRINSAREELYNLMFLKLGKDYNNIIDYYEAVIKYKIYSPVEDSFHPINRRGCFSFYPKNFTGLISATFRGVNIIEAHRILDAAVLTYPNVRGYLYRNTIYSNHKCFINKSNIHDNIIILSQGTKLTPTVKSYIKDTYENALILSYFTLEEFKMALKSVLDSITNKDVADLVAYGLYEALINRSIFIDAKTNSDFLKFKALNGSTKKTLNNEDIDWRLYENGGTFRYYKFKNIEEVIAFLKSRQKGIILTYKNSKKLPPVETLTRIAHVKGYEFFTANKVVVDRIRNLNPSCLVDLEWLLKKDPIISKFKAIVQVFGPKFSTLYANKVINLTRVLEAVEFNYITCLYNKMISCLYYSDIIKDSSIEADPYTLYVCQKLEKYIKCIKDCCALAETYNVEGRSVLAFLIIKTKGFKVNNRIYDEIKNNKVLNILCGKQSDLTTN